MDIDALLIRVANLEAKVKAFEPMFGDWKNAVSLRAEADVDSDVRDKDEPVAQAADS